MPWLMGVARHKLIDHYRRSQREERKLTLAWMANPGEAAVTEFDVTDTEALGALARLDALPTASSSSCRYLDDLSVSEVADAIGQLLAGDRVPHCCGLREALRPDPDGGPP